MKPAAIDYTKTSKILHWLIATLVLLMLSMSFFLDDLPKTMQATAYMIHKSFGLVIMMLMCVRILWLFIKGKPALSRAMPLWEKVLAQTVHYSFYLALLVMPLSGWIMSVAKNHVPVFFGLFKVPFPWIMQNNALGASLAQVHKSLAWILIALIVLHFTGALKHYFIDKDRTMQKMF